MVQSLRHDFRRRAILYELAGKRGTSDAMVLRSTDRHGQMDGGKVLRISRVLALTAFFVLNVACGTGDRTQRTELTTVAVALSPTENVAAASRGARAISNSTAASEQYGIANLNDGTPAAWGS